MSHFTVLVIGDDIEEQLAPYNENTEVKPYKAYWDSDDYAWRERIARQDGDLAEGEEATPEKLAEIFNRKWSSSEDDDENENRLYVDDGGVFEWSTYNRPWTRHVWCPGYSPTNHGEGSQANQSAWDEVLRAVRADETLGGIPKSHEESRRALHLLLRLHEGAQCGPDAGASPAMASVAEVRDHAGGVRGDDAATGRDVRDLPQDPEATEVALACGSLSPDDDDPGSALREVQHSVGSRGGELRLASCGSELPHEPHELSVQTVGGAKWDWYQVGGRWQGYYKLRPGAEGELGEPSWGNDGPRNDADVLCKGDVDVEAMENEARENAESWWDRADAVLRDLPTAQTWDSFMARVKEGDAGLGDPYTVDQAREEYHAQPRVAAVRAHDESHPPEEHIGSFFGSPVEDYQLGREEHVRRVVLQTIVPYAYLKDSEWYAPGKMGWFGMGSDTESDRVHFAEEFHAVFDALPDDTLLTLVDCHI